MKISNSVIILAAAFLAPTAILALTDEEQALKDACDACTGPAQFVCDGDLCTQQENTIPGLDELEQVYDGFCTLCTIDAIQNLDQGLCELVCDADWDGDNVNGSDPDVPNFEIPDWIPTDCFSEVSTVQVQNVGSVAMKDLELGASVLTANGAYETIFAWGHYNPMKSANFLQFETDSANNMLEMTAGHLVYLQGKANPVRADAVKVGDVLEGNSAPVKTIQSVKRTGVYTPLTPSGTIVVDGVTASGYISLQTDSAEYVQLQGGFQIMSWQQFVHMTLSPFRMFTMGVSSSMGNTYTQDGIPHYASSGMDLIQWLNQQNIVVQSFALVIAMLIFGGSMIVENTFGPSMAPLAMAVGAGAYFAIKNTGVSYKIKTV